jgi:hypothetical protein
LVEVSDLARWVQFPLEPQLKIKIMGITIISLVCIIIYTFLVGYQLGRRAVIGRINKKLNNK